MSSKEGENAMNIYLVKTQDDPYVVVAESMQAAIERLVNHINDEEDNAQDDWVPIDASYVTGVEIIANEDTDNILWPLPKKRVDG